MRHLILFTPILAMSLLFSACGNNRKLNFNPTDLLGSGAGGIFGPNIGGSTGGSTGGGTGGSGSGGDLDFPGWTAENGPGWPVFGGDDSGNGTGGGTGGGQTDIVADTPAEAEYSLSNGVPIPPISQSNTPADIVVMNDNGTLDFSNIPVGKNPLFSYFVILNRGGQMGYFKVDTDVNAPYRFEGVICRIPGPCIVRVSFAPTAPGEFRQDLSAKWRTNAAGGWPNSISLHLRGKAYEQLMAFGAGPEGGPVVNYWYPRKGVTNQFFTGAADNRGGARVAVADFNGDNILDIASTGGKDSAPRVRINYGPDMAQTVVLPTGFDEGMREGLYVAACDLNDDKKADLIFGASEGGAPRVTVARNDGQSMGQTFYAFEQSSRAGVRVACGDVNGDGTPDIITGAGEGGAPLVRVFDGKNFSNVLAQGFAGDSNDRSGVNVGFGYFDPTSAKGRILSGTKGRVVAWDAQEDKSLKAVFNFLPYGNFTGNVSTAAMYLNKDWMLDMATGAGNGGGPRVRMLDIFNVKDLGGFYAFEESFRGGVFVSGQ